jgi:hypothetical protein
MPLFTRAVNVTLPAVQGGLTSSAAREYPALVSREKTAGRKREVGWATPHERARSMKAPIPGALASTRGESSGEFRLVTVRLVRGRRGP